MPRCPVVFRGRFQNGMVVAWQGNGMACVNQTRPHCVNQMGNTQSITSAERHGRGTAWQGNGVAVERPGMYELAFKVLKHGV
jgi:hypothetical protein